MFYSRHQQSWQHVYVRAWFSWRRAYDLPLPDSFILEIGSVPCGKAMDSWSWSIIIFSLSVPKRDDRNGLRLFLTQHLFANVLSERQWSQMMVVVLVVLVLPPLVVYQLHYYASPLVVRKHTCPPMCTTITTTILVSCCPQLPLVVASREAVQ